MKEINNILKESKLRKTDCRIEILNLFLTNTFALSNADIENFIDQNFDRVTVYRTLKTFVKKGILHKVLDDAGIPKYALCKESCSQEEHHHQHVHFKCDVCGHTTCLNDVEIPKILLPQGYFFKEANLLINGICINCQTKS